MIQITNKFINRFGYQIRLEKSNFPFDIKGNNEFMDLYRQCKEYSMTSLERMFGLYQAVCYIIKNNIPGDFVECGVWKGGSAMMMALILNRYHETNRKLYLYDTFEGMSEPTEMDKTAKGTEAAALMKNKRNKESDTSVWCYSPLEEVKKNLLFTGYPEEQIQYIKGKVEDTLHLHLPGKLALLRLDTDWYESTRAELQFLYPLLEKKGVMIIDDFGHWEGAQKAVMEYFESIHEQPLLQRIDYTGRLMIKI